MQQLQLTRPRTGKRVRPKAGSREQGRIKEQESEEGGLSFRRLAGIANESAVNSAPAAPLCLCFYPFHVFLLVRSHTDYILKPNARGKHTLFSDNGASVFT